jgi:methylenetetrahydrofolate reductase (NADPH)
MHMNARNLPSVLVSDNLFQKIAGQWNIPDEGRKEAIERTARLGVVLKGIGYKGIHIGGIHGSFAVVERILDRDHQKETK